MTTEALEAGLPEIRLSPSDGGRLILIVRRPLTGEREICAEATLDLVEGLLGDNWLVRGSRTTPDGSARPECQLTLMNSRAAALVAMSDDRWQLAGDQLYVDLDLSIDNLPSGARLRIGESVVEVSERPHTGCEKFRARFGKDAFRFVNSPEGRELRLRGVNTRVVEPAMVRLGDQVRKEPAPVPAL